MHSQGTQRVFGHMGTRRAPENLVALDTQALEHSGTGTFGDLGTRTFGHSRHSRTPALGHSRH